ncbi:MAG: hypothetical protein ACI8PZ_000012 [Myxococcota bacterium]|jgi:hypothetical protein
MSLSSRWLTLCVMVAVGCQEYNLSKVDEGEGVDTAVPDATTPPETTEPTDTPEPEDTSVPFEGVPDILVEPPLLDFGALAAGETVEGMFTITNVGDGVLTLGEPSLGVGSDAFTLDAPSLIDIAPGLSVETFVEYSPVTGADVGVVLVPSNDPDTPVAEVDLRGQLLAPDIPTAVCGVTPSVVEAIHETATWVGSGSSDPDGRPLTYAWRLLTMPPGSVPSMPVAPPTEPDRAGFRPDLVGIYTAELVVTNDIGVSSEPCVAELEAIPASVLWVEMFWSAGGDDMDLHLVRDGGSLRTGQDCYYANCKGAGLAWGPGGPAGDPVLDIDDIPGRGPENINIEFPENVIYQVWVHDYPGSRYTPANDVTVRIYLSGVLAWEDTRPISGEDSDNPFAEIDWASRTVTGR